MKILPSFVRAGLIRFCRAQFSERAIRASFPRAEMQEPVSLHMVISEKTWKMGLMALRSLEWQTGLRWHPYIHDDGSLGENIMADLMALQPDARIIRRTEADARCTRLLDSFEACRENRSKHNWFLKFFDTYFLAPRENYIVLDSDIIFFRRPREIMEWIARRGDDLHFMEDTREAYACPREELESGMGLEFWRMVNSGICLMNKQAVDLGLAEKFMARFAGTARHFQFLEQSLFALTGSAWKKGGLLPKTYEISWGNFRQRDAVCRHYVGPFKDDALYVEGATSFWLDLKTKKKRE